MIRLLSHTELERRSYRDLLVTPGFSLYAYHFDKNRCNSAKHPPKTFKHIFHKKKWFVMKFSFISWFPKLLLIVCAKIFTQLVMCFIITNLNTFQSYQNRSFLKSASASNSNICLYNIEYIYYIYFDISFFF